MSRERWLILCHHLVPALVLVGLLTALIPASMVKADTVVYFPDANLEAAVRQAIGKPDGDIYQSDLDTISGLAADHRGIVNLSGLEHCTQWTWLGLWDNQISNISPLASCTNLVELYLGVNQISNIGAIASLTRLKILNIDTNKINDISPLAGHTSLQKLWAYKNQISDISPLASLTNLQELLIYSNQISDVSSLASLNNLTRLDLWENQISDISSLASLTSLQWLDLDVNQITDIPPLASLANLQLLDLGNNKLSDNISSLASLTSLQALYLDNNQISDDISPLASLTDLQHLELHDNKISDISPLASLTNLTELDIDHNEISDVEPLVNNPGMDSGDKLDLQSDPLDSESVDKWIPDLVARGVQVSWEAGKVSGSVEDGFTHKLGGARVKLLFQTTTGQMVTIADNITDDNGEYSINVGPGKYTMEVYLEYHRTAGDTATFSITYDTGPAVYVYTDEFEVDKDQDVAKAISFDDPSLHPPTGIPPDRLDDLAEIYYNVKQVVDFDSSQLGVTLDLNLPIEVHGYVSDNPSTTTMDESKTAYYSDGQVYIGVDRSDHNSFGKPWAPDWHEVFHELMDDTVGIPPRHTGDTGHGGYANHCTGNSWVEGWAEFWPCALARSLGVPEWYLFWGTTSLEQNWRVWDSDGGISREEFAVASLLVDLVDPASPGERDFISMTNSQLWAIAGTQPLANMFEVYSALAAAKVGQTDSDADGISDLDVLFIEHGFFADDGNGSYDGETVGLAGKPGRQSTMLVPNAYLRIIVADSQGNPVTDGTLLVDVVFASPQDIYNYSYEVDLHSSDSLQYFEVAPDRCDALMTMRVKDSSGALSDELTMSNNVYWDRVSGATEGYAAEHTFVIGAEGKTTEVEALVTTSGGVPVWIWPIVGVVVIAAAAGGFLLFRRRARTG